MAIENNNLIKIPYEDEYNECQLQVVFSIENIKAQEILTRKLRMECKQKKQACDFMRQANLMLENEIKIDEQKKESLLIGLNSLKMGNLELRKQLLLAKDKKQNMIEIGNNNLKKYEEHWLICKKRFETIPYINRYLLINNKIETLRSNNENLINENKKKCSLIIIKKRELFDLDKKRIIELADYMINKRPLILKRIEENTIELKKLENQKKIKGSVENYQTKISEMPASNTTNIQKANNIVTEEIKNNSKNKDNETMVLPRLKLQNIDLIPIKFNQIPQVHFKNDTSIEKAGNSAVAMDMDKVPIKKVKMNEVHDSLYFTSPTSKEDSNASSQTKKYSNRKIIHILEDIKLDTAGTYKIISNLKPNQLQNVNEIDPKMCDLKENKTSQDKANIEVTEVIDEDSTKQSSQDIIFPPTQYLDLTQNSQEKRVTFNTVITIQNPKNLTDYTKSQDKNEINESTQINTSTASDESYKKIKDYVFKKHNLNLSPEFAYTNNSVVPKGGIKNTVTSKYFDENPKDKDINGKDEEIQAMDTTTGNDPENDIREVTLEQHNKAHATSDDVFERQKNAAHTAEAMFKHYTPGISDSLNISMGTTLEDSEADFLPCIDSNLLLSPKADDVMQTRGHQAEVLSSEVPNFLSGLRRTTFSFFGPTSSEANPESDVQNQTKKFNFNFGDEKIKRGGIFSMFR